MEAQDRAMFFSALLLWEVFCHFTLNLLEVHKTRRQRTSSQNTEEKDHHEYAPRLQRHSTGRKLEITKNASPSPYTLPPRGRDLSVRYVRNL